MKTLLLLINNYDVTKDFIYYVIRLAKMLNLKLRIVHAQNPHGVTSQTGILNSEMLMLQQHFEDIRDAVRRHIDTAIAEFKENQLIDEDIIFEHRIGAPSNVLNEMLEKGEIDMVALQSQVEDSVVSSAQSNFEIIKYVMCPIWIIPATTNFAPIKKAIYATDFQEQDVIALKRIADIMEERQIEEIIAVHLCESDDFTQQVMSKGFEAILKDQIKSQNVRVMGCEAKKDLSTAEQIMDFAREQEANLVIVMKDNKTFMQRLFSKSFTLQLTKDMAMPLLVLHKRNEL